MRVLLATGPMHPEPGGAPLADGGAHAGTVAAALAEGWRRARPRDLVTALPLPDGGPGSARALEAGRVAERCVLPAAGPLGQERRVELVRLARAGTAAHCATSTWFLDAAGALALSADRDQAAREALEGSTAGLGSVMVEALVRVRSGDTLVVGLSRSAVHDGGQGLVARLGGVEASRDLLSGREIVLALADPTALGGLGGAGQGLTALTGLEPEQVQEIDRRACAAAARTLAAATATAAAAGVSGAALAGPTGPALSVTSWGTGAGGGAAAALRSMGARALPGAVVMARLLGLERAAAGHDLLVTTVGEAYDVPADGVPAVVGRTAARLALPAVLLAGSAGLPRGELAEAGIVACYALEDMDTGALSWYDGGDSEMRRRLLGAAGRLARSWSR